MLLHLSLVLFLLAICFLYYLLQCLDLRNTVQKSCSKVKVETKSAMDVATHDKINMFL